MQLVLTDFQGSLQRVRNVADDAAANAAAAMADPQLQQRYDTILSAVVVTLSGFLESFLRQIAEDFADGINQQNHQFASLKEPIRCAHFEGGAKVLGAFGGGSSPSRYSWTNTDAMDTARRLGSVVAGTGYELVWEAFAETKGNPGPDVISEFLRRFGVPKPLETLAHNMAAPGLSPQLLDLSLKSFIAVRNECAHNGLPTQTPTASDVEGYCDLLSKIATAIVATLTAHQVT